MRRIGRKSSVFSVDADGDDLEDLKLVVFVGALNQLKSVNERRHTSNRRRDEIMAGDLSTG